MILLSVKSRRAILSICSNTRVLRIGEQHGLVQNVHLEKEDVVVGDIKIIRTPVILVEVNIDVVIVDLVENLHDGGLVDLLKDLGGI